jgi:glycosyltransferase involved in cell wall biosynthesis
MEDSAFFSVVIPTHNRGTLIRETIESVLAQTFRDFEIVVVDDGSTDDTPSVVAGIPSDKISYYRRANAERGAARNFGTHVSRGHYVNFLDSDDLLLPHHLDSARRFCSERGDAPIFHQAYEVRDRRGRRLRLGPKITSVNRDILSGNVLSCNGVFVPRALALAHPFNEDRALASLEDWELWLRLCARYPFLDSKVVTSVIVQHAQRSMMSTDVSKILLAVDRFVEYVLQDEGNRKSFGGGLDRVAASAWTYAALHLAVAGGHRRTALRYLGRAVGRFPREALRRRTAVILGKLAGL